MMHIDMTSSSLVVVERSNGLLGTTGRPRHAVSRSTVLATDWVGGCYQRVRVATGDRLLRPRIRMGSQP
jgi:hypothetical protein